MKTGSAFSVKCASHLPSSMWRFEKEIFFHDPDDLHQCIECKFIADIDQFIEIVRYAHRYSIFTDEKKEDSYVIHRCPKCGAGGDFLERIK